MPETVAAPGQVTPPVLQAVKLTKHFRLGGMFSRHHLHALDDVDITIGGQEIVALVGESGSGKSTMARLLATVYRPTAGTILYEGRPLGSLRSRKDILEYRGRVPMVFQDPYSSLNPVFRVSHGVMRFLRLHRPELTRAQRYDEAQRVFTAVGLQPAEDFLRKFPYEMSGGQRQRVGFAQALALRPKVILADEPVSMLDVSIRAGILNLMIDLRDREAVSCLYITHDIASARYVADRIIVLYAGHVVESGPSEEVLRSPRHPYTQLLLSAVPDPRAPLAVASAADVGEPPRVIDPGVGCRFRFRCPIAVERCSAETPLPHAVGVGHEAACHLAVPAGSSTVSTPGEGWRNPVEASA
jgi:oligopeptide/dipeptide ABC transporter ATP-binding protein